MLSEQKSNHPLNLQISGFKLEIYLKTGENCKKNIRIFLIRNWTKLSRKQILSRYVGRDRFTLPCKVSARTWTPCSTIRGRTRKKVGICRGWAKTKTAEWRDKVRRVHLRIHPYQTLSRIPCPPSGRVQPRPLQIQPWKFSSIYFPPFKFVLIYILLPLRLRVTIRNKYRMYKKSS